MLLNLYSYNQEQPFIIIPYTSSSNLSKNESPQTMFLYTVRVKSIRRINAELIEGKKDDQNSIFITTFQRRGCPYNRDFRFHFQSCITGFDFREKPVLDWRCLGSLNFYIRPRTFVR